MPRKIVSALLTAGVVLLVIMWIASDPPPPSSARAGSSAEDAPSAGARDVRLEQREAVPAQDEVGVAPPLEQPASEPEATTPNKLSHQNPPGVLEVLVLLDNQPLAGASVRLLRGGNTRAERESAIEEVAAIPTDARGLAVFEGLDGDRHLIAEVRSEPDVVATGHALLRKGEPTWRIVMQLGGGGVEGRAYALDGSPQSGVYVDVTAQPQDSGQFWGRTVRTGIDGAYRVSGIPRGKATLFAGNFVVGLDRQVDVELSAGEWKHVDFGAPQRALSWSGRVKLASGANVEGFANFQARETVRGEQIPVPCSANGEFVAQLPPGEYSANAWSGVDRVELARLTLADHDLVRDLVLPGIQVRGRVTYSGTWHDAAQPAASAQIWLESVGGTKRLAQRNGDDHFVAYCLDKGEYVLTTWPNPLLGAGEKGLRLQLDGSRDDVVVDLTITDP